MFIDARRVGRKKYVPFNFLSVKNSLEILVKLFDLLGHMVMLNLIQKIRLKANRNVIKNNLSTRNSRKIVRIEK
jgi:hypothetical protein